MLKSYRKALEFWSGFIISKFNFVIVVVIFNSIKWLISSHRKASKSNFGNKIDKNNFKI